MQNTKTKLVIFDMAGTTVKDDDHVSEAFQSALAKENLHLSISEINPIMGFKKPEAISIILKKHFPEHAADSALADRIHRNFVKTMLHYYTESKTLSALPNVEQTFAKLKAAGIKTGLNTGFSRDIAELILNRLQWKEKGFIDFLAASDDVENGRPNPAMINNIMQEAGITNPLEIVKVGDTMVDIQEARNAGCSIAVAITTGAYTRNELEVYTPDYIIDDMAELINIIDG